MLSGLLGFLFYSLRDHLGLYAFLGYVATCWLVEWWFERWFIIPCAGLHMEIQKQNKPVEATAISRQIESESCAPSPHL